MLNMFYFKLTNEIPLIIIRIFAMPFEDSLYFCRSTKSSESLDMTKSRATPCYPGTYKRY